MIAPYCGNINLIEQWEHGSMVLASPDSLLGLLQLLCSHSSISMEAKSKREVRPAMRMHGWKSMKRDIVITVLLIVALLIIWKVTGVSPVDAWH